MSGFHGDTSDALSSTDDVKEPSRAAAVLAAAMPLVMTLTAAVTLVVAHGPSGTLRLAEDAGWVFYGAGLATAAGACVMSALLWLAARGTAVPTAFSLALALVPWGLGFYGGLRAVGSAMSAARVVPMTVRDRIAAVAFVEECAARLVGAWGSSALAGGLALGLAIAALGQRVTEKTRGGVWVGALLALPVVALVGYALVSGVFGAQGTLYVVASVRTCAALVLAAAAVGVSPRGRAGALATSVGPACTVALITAGLAATHGAIRDALRDVATLAPSAVLDGVGVAVRVAFAGWLVFGSAAGVMLVASLLLAWWAFRKGQMRLGLPLGAMALSGGTLAFVVVVSAGESSVGKAIAEGTAHPWTSVPHFAPSVVPATEDTGLPRPAAFIGIDGVYPSGTGAAIPSDLLATNAARQSMIGIFRANRAQRRVDAPLGGEGFERPAAASTRDDTPALTLAFDENVDATLLRTVLDVAAESGARAIDLVGVRIPTREVVVSVPDLQRPEGRPFRAIAQPIGSVRVLLASAVDGRVPPDDTALWHALVGEEGPPRLLPRPGATDAPRPLDGTRVTPIAPLADPRAGAQPNASTRPLAWLVVTEYATAQQLASAAYAASAQGFEPLALTGALPSPGGGMSQQPMGGRVVARGTASAPPGGDVAASGQATAPPDALLRDAVAGTVRARIAEIQACYDAARAQTPTLQGRVVVRFAVRPDGRTETVSVAMSSFPDERVPRCLVGLVETLRFPAGERDGPVLMSFPFVFAPP